MNLYYIANARIPTEKAHGIHIIKMCEEFARCGVNTTLIVPKRKNTIFEDPFTYYGVEKNFTIEYIPMFDLVGNPLFYWISQATFATSLFFYSIRKDSETVIFSRDILPAYLLTFKRKKVFFDMHGFPEQFVWFWRHALKRMRGVVLTNRQKIDRAKSILHLSEEKLLVCPNGYDPKLFEIPQKKEELKKELELPEGETVMYTGHLYSWKGASVFAETARLLPEVNFIFVGGTEQKVTAFKEKYKFPNIYFLGHKKYTEIPKYLKAADVLVLPNSGKSFGRRTTHSLYDTSPIKMFEYMASGTPIVATKLPSIEEILNDSNSELIEPDNPEQLARGIKRVLDYPDYGEKISYEAKNTVSKFTWHNRAQNIIEFISKHT